MQTIPSGRALLITQFDLGNGRWIQSRFKGAGKNFVACMLLEVGNLTLNFNKLQYMYVLVLKQPLGIEQVLKNLSLRSRNSQKKTCGFPDTTGTRQFLVPIKSRHLLPAGPSQTSRCPSDDTLFQVRLEFSYSSSWSAVDSKQTIQQE